MRSRSLAAAIAFLLCLGSCGEDGTRPSAEGALQVVTTTAGGEDSTRGYRVVLDDGRAATVGAEDSVTFSGVSPGRHEVELTGVDSACAVSGDNPRSVGVFEAERVRVTFAVECEGSEDPGSGQLDVVTDTKGGEGPTGGYRVVLDDGRTLAIGAEDTVTFSGVSPGRHEVELTRVKRPCSVTGDNPRTVGVLSSERARVTFSVACQLITGIEFDFSTHRREAEGADNWPVTWSEDGHQYAFGGDGRGFCGFSTKKSWMAARIEGPHDSYSATDRLGGDCARYSTSLDGKTHGAPISVDGTVYFWLTPGSGTKGYESSTLYKSGNQLRSTTEVREVRFTASRHSIAYMGFVNHGRDHAAGDGYVYSIGIEPAETRDIFTDQHDHIHLLRAPEDDLEDRASYEWFTGLSESEEPTWGTHGDRTPIYSEEDQIGPFPQMVYVPDLDRYVLTIETGQTSSDLLVLEAPNPWGSWSEVLRRDGWGEGIEKSVFQWQFAPKWFRNEGRDFTVVFSGDDRNDSWNTVDGSFQLNEP